MPDDAIAVAGGQDGDLIRVAVKNDLTGRLVNEPYFIDDVPWTVWGTYYTTLQISPSAIGANNVLVALVANVYDVTLRKVFVNWANVAAAAANTLYISRSNQVSSANGTPIAVSAIDFAQSAAGVYVPTPQALVIPTPTGSIVGSSREMIGSKSATNGATDTIVRDYSADDQISPVLAQQSLSESFVVSLASAPNINTLWSVGLVWQEIAQ